MLGLQGVASWPITASLNARELSPLVAHSARLAMLWAIQADVHDMHAWYEGQGHLEGAMLWVIQADVQSMDRLVDQVIDCL